MLRKATNFCCFKKSSKNTREKKTKRGTVVRSTTPFRPWHEVHFFVVSVWGGVGWGGVGMLPFFELAHMVDAMSSVGFGVGWRCYRSLNLHTWSMLRLLRGLGCVGDVTVLSFLELAHMVDATSTAGCGVCWGCYRSFVP